MMRREGLRLYIEEIGVSGFVMQRLVGRRRPEDQLCTEGKGQVHLVVDKGGRTMLFPIFWSFLE